MHWLPSLTVKRLWCAQAPNPLREVGHFALLCFGMYCTHFTKGVGSPINILLKGSFIRSLSLMHLNEK